MYEVHPKSKNKCTCDFTRMVWNRDCEVCTMTRVEQLLEDVRAEIGNAGFAAAVGQTALANDQVPVKRVPQPGMRQAAMLLMQATSSPSSMASKVLMIQTMMQVLKSMYEYQQATAQKQAARQVETAVRGSLMEVRNTLPAVPATAGTPARSDGRSDSQRTGQSTAADVFKIPGQVPARDAVNPPVRPPSPSKDPARLPQPPGHQPGQPPEQSPGRRR